MMGQCKECPGHQGLTDYLSQCDEHRDFEEITYKQWVDFEEITYKQWVRRLNKIDHHALLNQRKIPLRT